jgi:formylmethanofuran dehydrogenase subunit C
MRRGTVIARGKFGAAAGSRMVGGTLWTETGFGPRPGPLLRRGTLIGPSVDEVLPTFADCGRIDPVILRIISRAIAETLGPLAPKALPATVRKLAGDQATIGKGEILLTA